MTDHSMIAHYKIQVIKMGIEIIMGCLITTREIYNNIVYKETCNSIRTSIKLIFPIGS